MWSNDSFELEIGERERAFLSCSLPVRHRTPPLPSSSGRNHNIMSPRPRARSERETDTEWKRPGAGERDLLLPHAAWTRPCPDNRDCVVQYHADRLIHQRNSGSHMRRKRYAWLRRRGRNSRKTRVTPCRVRPSVRREKLVREGRAGRQFSQAGMPDASSLLSPFLFLPLVAIVILIRHSNNDSLAANWPKEREGGEIWARAGG